MQRKKATIVTVITSLVGIAIGLTIWGMIFLGYGNASTGASSQPQLAVDSEKVPETTAPIQDSKPTEPDNSSLDSGESTSQSDLSSSSEQPPAANSDKSSSPTQPPQAVQLTGPAADVVWSVSTTANAVFITVDDGWYPTDSVLAIMRAQHVPISAFLIENAAKEHPDFWREFMAAGGDIENHTLSHPDLTKVSTQEVISQIETTQKYLSSFSPPTLFRPPYGNYNQTVSQAVYQAGIKHVIMWNATMSNNELQTYNGKPLEPGSIILLHWEPDLSSELEKLLGILRQNHLGVASLPYALSHPNNFPVIWPLPEAAD
ncbi:polysaccharide deacetylase family protein [Desulfosporosinus sp. PR]|uniref:polysaccharide deacetylase family protein n=1 Tax=Candidatus Desulfosporosinus nitrosoreducens TaxID=3401928 RepID=UPI0027FCA16A|nr:polysaccharide deacetylase family protein [Desulfosporosinus sp. PR]MDQ7092734.1 polysaccharide deacetylase family protein [Desulfosporosinus sp. PR]